MARKPKVPPRPLCETEGCDKHAVRCNWKADGSPAWRRWCSGCHSRRTAARHGLKRISQLTAQRASMTETEYKNQYHPYLKHRRDFCENRDGRLGYRCRYKIRHSAQLQVDHINGNPRDNSVTNLQTLCANCHVFKTHANQDYRTPGRKTLKCQ